MFNVITDQLLVLFVLSIRVLVLISFVPVISSPQAPFFVRIALAGSTVFALQTMDGMNVIQAPATLAGLLVLVIGEALIGAIIGFFIQMMFSMISAFSEFFTTQMGLRAAQILNPITQSETVVIGQFTSMLVLLVFISSHSIQKVFYYGVAQSFQVLTAQKLLQSGNNSLSFIFYSFSELFERTFIIAFPLFISLLLVNVGLGLVGKVAPQMNLLIVGIPVQIAVGLVLFLIFVPNIIYALEIIMEFSFRQISSFLRNFI